MTLYLNLDQDRRAYFTLTCDRCAAPFVCYDDACYSLASLCTEAIFAGWDAGPRPEQPHRCPDCARARPTPAHQRVAVPRAG
jgi:hypothetical protein